MSSATARLNLSQKSRRRAVAPPTPHPLAPQQLTRVLAYIGANIGRDIALIDLAQVVGVSKDHFIRSFRAATRRTPYAYVVDRRLARAVDALKHSPTSIERIAREAGFKAHPDFPTCSKSTMECREASSGPGHTERGPNWLCPLPPHAYPRSLA
jgi:transcriptional regulator GlxA family with amidase domain